MCRNPATTAPLTTLATMSTATASPRMPNTTRNTTNVDASAEAASRSARYDCEPSSPVGGRTAVDTVPPANRYSICRLVGCSAPIWAGATQASAERLTVNAKPTTVNSGPFTTLILVPRPVTRLGALGSWLSTISPAALAQRPFHRFSRSTAPAGSARPTTLRVSGGTCGSGSSSTLACSNGPATASTPGRFAASVSWAAVTADGSNAAI